MESSANKTWIKQFYKENQDMCGENNMDRIIGGKVAALGQYPWIVQLAFRRNSFSCFSNLANGLINYE